MENIEIASIHDTLQKMITTRLNHVSSHLAQLKQAILLKAKAEHPTLNELALKSHPDFKTDLMNASSLQTQAMTSAWTFRAHIKTLDECKIGPNLYDTKKLFSDDPLLKHIQTEALQDTINTAESIIGNYKLVWPAMSTKYANELNQLAAEAVQEKKAASDALKSFSMGAS